MHNEYQDDDNDLHDDPPPFVIFSFILIFASVFLMAAGSVHH